jgi:hypothetical protein
MNRYPIKGAGGRGTYKALLAIRNATRARIDAGPVEPVAIDAGSAARAKAAVARGEWDDFIRSAMIH